MTATRARRPRRSSAQVRSLLLAAARDLFSEHGYNGASTRAIAERAGVSENLLYRNFGSKEQLFEASVGEPIDAFMQEWAASWTSIDTSDPDEMIRSFVTGLYDLACRNRKLLHAATPGHLGSGAQVPMRRIEAIAAEVVREFGFGYDIRISIRSVVAMVITMAVFEGPLFGGDVPPRDAIIDDMVLTLQHGLKRSNVT